MSPAFRPPDEYEAEEFLRSPKTRRMLKKIEAPEVEAAAMGNFERHPLYRKAVKLGAYVHRVATLYRPRKRKRDAKPVNELVLNTYMAGATLAAGLGRIDDAEIGFSIAYLKRALQSMNRSLQTIREIREKNHLPTKAADHVLRRLISLRDDIVGEVMTLRQLWREKFAH